MRYVISGLMFLNLTACLQSQSQSDTEGAPVSQPIQNMLTKEGCTVTKVKGVISVSCSDGSTASADTTPPPPGLSVKDANQAYANLRLITVGQGFNIMLNTDTGNILFYGSNGIIIGLSMIYFEAANCAGSMWTNYGVQGIGNVILPNETNSSAFSGFTVGLKITGKTSYSYLDANGCHNSTQVQGGASWYNVNAVQFNEHVPNQFALPLTIGQ